MATDFGNIDDLLATGAKPSPSQPQTHEIEQHYDNSETDTDFSSDVDYSNHDRIDNEDHSEDLDNSTNDNDTEQEHENNTKESSLDEYGNEKPKQRMYTEEEHRELVNKAVRERLARGNHSTNQQTATEQATQFSYNPDSEQTWEQQLERFVENTVNKLTQKQVQQQKLAQEQAAEQEFAERFTTGMERFHDFRDVVGSQPITDPMTLALRGVADPAAFIYAASKKHPTELDRISKLRDPYKQMVEMGKLEERMRKRPEGTKAPRPISRTSDDSPMKEQKKSKEPSIEDLIAQSEAKRVAKFRQYRGK